MSPSGRIVLILADVNERNLDYSDQVMLFRIVVMVPNLQVQILRFIWDPSPYLQGLIPFRIQTRHRISLHLVPTKFSYHICIHIS